MDGILTATTNLCQSGLGINGNERVVAKAPSSDMYLLPFPGRLTGSV